MFTLDTLIRLVVALVLGGAIGMEREYRSKDAGFRTHFLVALGSAVFTIISQTGFSGGDPARVAAQVVSGIGFLGAGTIIFQRNFIRGLTTAAGLWVTAAVGMACGVGMYLLAACGTALVLLGLEVLYRFIPPVGSSHMQVSFSASDEQSAIRAAGQVRAVSREVYSYAVTRQGEGGGASFRVAMQVKMRGGNPAGRLVEMLCDFSDVSVSRTE